MKISKILASISALAVVAAMAIPAAAGDGAPIGIPDGWVLDKKQTMATRFIVGAVEDGAMLENTPETWEKLFSATAMRVTITGDDFGQEGWEGSGALVLNQNYWGWSQVDWNIGDSLYNKNDDGSYAEVNPDKNLNITNIYVSGNKYTLEIAGPDFCEAVAIEPATDTLLGFLKAAQDNEAYDLTQEFLSINVQSFDEDTTKGWNILGFELVDAAGNRVVGEGEVAMGDLYNPEAAVNGGSTGGDTTGDSSTGDTTGGSSTGSANGGSASGSTNSGSSTSTSGNKKPSTSTSTSTSTSDKTADTGAAEGLALAGIALAGAAFVISKKK